jgi:hypothetical protein
MNTFAPAPTARRPHREPPGLWRHAAGRARRLRPAQGPRAAIAVLREAVEAGVNHIDTSDFYGPARHQPDHPRGAASLFATI